MATRSRRQLNKTAQQKKSNFINEDEDDEDDEVFTQDRVPEKARNQSVDKKRRINNSGGPDI